MGVGPYTANAVASFAFNNGDAVVDTNVKRVLHRAFAVPDDDDAFVRLSSRVMPAGESRVWNNAIMELGGVACGTTPRCDEAGCVVAGGVTPTRPATSPRPTCPSSRASRGLVGQFRGRVVRILGEYDELALDDLGPAFGLTTRPTASTAGSGCADSSRISRTTGSWRSRSARQTRSVRERRSDRGRRFAASVSPGAGTRREPSPVYRGSRNDRP